MLVGLTCALLALGAIRHSLGQRHVPVAAWQSSLLLLVSVGHRNHGTAFVVYFGEKIQ